MTTSEQGLCPEYMTDACTTPSFPDHCPIKWVSGDVCLLWRCDDPTTTTTTKTTTTTTTTTTASSTTSHEGKVAGEIAGGVVSFAALCLAIYKVTKED
jgi:hypothetical protein